MSVDYMSSEHLEPDGYLQPRRFRITYLCHRCQKEFTRTVTKIDSRDPSCPKRKCREAALEEEVDRRARNLAKMLEEGRGPATIGDKIVVKAIDETAKIVMEDHGLTDLKDNIRVGESMAPKLPPEQQKLADNFFSGNALARAGIPSRQAQLLGRRAIAGAFRSTAINPSNLLGAKPGEKAPIQTPIGTQKIG